MSIVFHDIEQNTEEWLDLRAGKITSSGVAKVMANYGKAFGAPAKRYAQQIAIDLFLGKRVEVEGVKTQYMERGHLLEPRAIEEYQLLTLRTAINGGFYVSACGRLGDSPDARIEEDEDRLLEVKSVAPTTQLENIKRGAYDPGYKWQLQHHLKTTGKQIVDFISYCPEFPEGKQLKIYEVEKDRVMQDQMEERISLFWENEVKKNLEILGNI